MEKNKSKSFIENLEQEMDKLSYLEINNEEDYENKHRNADDFLTDMITYLSKDHKEKETIKKFLDNYYILKKGYN